jgi:hypothetical protein
MIESVLACVWSCTADSTGTRGRVTAEQPRATCPRSPKAFAYSEVWPIFLESIKYQASAPTRLPIIDITSRNIENR